MKKKFSKKAVRALSFAAAAALAATAVIPCFGATTVITDNIAATSKKDVNSDGYLTCKDVLTLKLHMAGLLPTDTAVLDLNDDGVFDTKDASYLSSCVQENEAVTVTYFIRNPVTGASLMTLSNYQNAKNYVDANWMMGYAATDEKGNLVYSYGTSIQNKMMYQGKALADYIRANSFTYGNAATNPAIDDSEKIVSCDRFVGWVLYDIGYTDQPTANGLTVFPLRDYCIEKGFQRIESEAQLQPGDIVFTDTTASDGATNQVTHVFIHAGTAADGQHYRYDMGSNYRIQNVQPFKEAMVNSNGESNFCYAYRPVNP